MSPDVSYFTLSVRQTDHLRFSIVLNSESGNIVRSVLEKMELLPVIKARSALV